MKKGDVFGPQCSYNTSIIGSRIWAFDWYMPTNVDDLNCYPMWWIKMNI